MNQADTMPENYDDVCEAALELGCSCNALIKVLRKLSPGEIARVVSGSYYGWGNATTNTTQGEVGSSCVGAGTVK